VDAFIEFLRESPQNVRLIFVDDGSRDDTLKVLGQVKAAVPDVVILPKSPNAGKAEAVRHGMLYALEHTDVPVVGFWDADLATPLPELYGLLGVLQRLSDIDIVFGSRVKLLGRRIERKPQRHYLGRVFATVVSNVLRLPVYDTQCGAKLFRRTPQLAAVLGQPFLSRWIFDVEILARFIRDRGIEYVQNSVYEYPLNEWCDVGGSKVKPADFIKAIVELVRIWNDNLRTPGAARSAAAS
jgi:glycosyltransferase involved in cell wall biosynthesis